MLHRDLNARALSVDVFGDLEDLAELPVVVDADWIRVSAELDVRRTEWGSGLDIVFVSRQLGHAKPD